MQIVPQPTTKLYKQEGKTGMFQSMLWALAVSRAATSHLPQGWGEYFCYFKNNYLGVYWDARGMEKVAHAVIALAPRALPEAWETEWQRLDDALTAAARELIHVDMTALSIQELRAWYERMFDLDQKMWTHAIFIDTFDPGYDQARMKEIAAEHGLSEEEVQTLVTPAVPAYVTEWSRAMLGLRAGAVSREAVREKYFWIATDYFLWGEVTDAFLDEELAKPHEVEFVSPVEKQRVVLEKHGLAANPLQTFQTLTTWRDIRKRLNYTGLYGLLKIVREALRRSGIDPALANGVLPKQMPDLIDGKLTEREIRTQFEGGTLFHVDADGKHAYLFGADAGVTHVGLEAAIHADQPSELSGMVASRGKAVGRVCIVPHITNHNASLMREGDILVTSMTRPEFVPLMRLAGAIVTNEGGITSHAAIVSRELGKPCIIGTKNATVVLQQGDEVEVDAEAGVIRILGNK